MEVIIYHKNCMDGLASAFIAKDAFEKDENINEENILTIALQYGDENKFFEDLDLLLVERNEDLNIYFVDFSFKSENMKKLLNIKNIKKVVVIDHHKTAYDELSNFGDEFENFEFIYNVHKSGATLCYDYFKSNLKRDFFAYIEDRDLWNWNIPYSKHINAYLQVFIEPNEIESFRKEHDCFDFYTSLEIGRALLKKQEQQVESKTKKVNSINLLGVEFNYVNATENISEIGNAICNKYNTPALVFFVNDKKEYVCSLRSLDNLADVSLVAKSFGGGGHRNAAGFTLDESEFFLLFYEPEKKQVSSYLSALSNLIGVQLAAGLVVPNGFFSLFLESFELEKNIRAEKLKILKMQSSMTIYSPFSNDLKLLKSKFKDKK